MSTLDVPLRPAPTARPDAEPEADPGATHGPAVLAAYASPALGLGFVWGLLSLYYMKFATDVLLLAPATVGLIFAVSRLWDGLTDPMVGSWSDRTRSRFGRRRPWIVASALPIALAFLAVWSPPASLTGSALVAWSAAALLLLYTAITLLNVPHKALGAELEPGHHAKTRVFAASGFGEHTGTILAAAALALIEASEDPRGVARVAALAVGVVVVGGIAFCAARVPEQTAHRGRGGRDPAHAALRDVLRNRAARLLLAVFFLEYIGQTLFVSALPYAADYMLNAPGAVFQFLGAALVATLLSIPVWTRLSRRYGKVRLWRISLLGKLLLFAPLFAVRGPEDHLLIVLLSVVYGAMTGCGVTVSASLKADVVDEDEARTGERREGVFFSAWNLVVKLGVALALAVSGFVLSATGFEPNVEQAPLAIFGIRSLVSLLPLAFHLAALLVLLGLHLDASEHQRIRHRIAARRAREVPE